MVRGGWWVAAIIFIVAATHYCFHNLCHEGMTVSETKLAPQAGEQADGATAGAGKVVAVDGLVSAGPGGGNGAHDRSKDGTAQCNSPMRWEDVRHYVISGQVHRLRRSAQQLAEYRAWRNETLAKFDTIADYLRHRVFGHRLRRQGNGRHVAEPPSPNDEPRIVWRPNDFPYYFEAGIEHHILWYEQGPPTDESVAEAIARERPGYETVTWVNPVELQSVRGLHHAHVLSIRVPATAAPAP